MIIYSNHDGKSLETAIVISGALTAPVGIEAEYTYVASKLGVEGEDWMLIQQSLIHDEEESFDILEIETKEGETKLFHFNITEFYDKY